MRKINVGVVGCGDAAQHVYLSEFHRLQDRAQLVAVCDRVEARAHAARRRFGAQASYMDLHRFLRESDVELVLNLTPHHAHGEVSLAALEAGRHVYTEKPMAQSLDEATQLIEAARAHRVKLACAPVTLLLPTMRRWQQRLREGAMGRPTFARAQALAAPLWEGFSPDHAWYFTAGSGPLMDMGVYALTGLTGLFGPALRVSAMSGTILPERVMRDGPFAGTRIQTHVDDPVHVHLDFGGCARHWMSPGASRPAATNSWKCTARRERCPVTPPPPICPCIGLGPVVPGGSRTLPRLCPAATTGSKASRTSWSASSMIRSL